MDDALAHLATLIPARGEPVLTLDDGASGVWRVRASKLTVRVDLRARTAVRSTDTVASTAADPLDGLVLPLVEIRSCTVGGRLSIVVQDEQGAPVVIKAKKVRYLQPVDEDAAERRDRHLQALRDAVAAGGDSPDDRRAALHFGARWAAVGEAYGLSGVQAAARWKEQDRAAIARLREARGESNPSPEGSS